MEFLDANDPTLDRNRWLGAYLAAHAGLRHSEICNAQWDSLHCDGQPYI